MACNDKKNENALTDDELNEVSGGYFGAKFNGENTLVDIGDVIGMWGLEFVCFYNDNNEVLKFIRYSPNIDWDGAVMELTSDQANFSITIQIVRRGEFQYLRDNGLLQ